MKKIKIAFVGCGGIGDHYLDVYRDLDFIEVSVCIDVSLERAERASAKLGNGARASVSFTDALGGDVDAVLINTPNHLHREQAVTTLEAGKHLLLQKPVAANLIDAEAIVAAAMQAARQGVVSGLYLSYFDQPLMHDLRSMIEQEWFGQITHLYARLMHRGGLTLSKQIREGEPNWRASSSQTGGGCFIQLAVHYVHLFKWMMGATVARVSAMTKHLACPGVEGEDLACALLEFSNGAVATMDMAWNTAGEQLSIHGTRGTCEYIGNRNLLLDSSAGAFRGRTIDYMGVGGQLSPGAPGSAPAQQATTVIAPALGNVNNPFNQHRMFWEAVRDGQPPFVSIESGVDDLRVVEAVYRSAATGRIVEVGS
jgi:UDP-N-acetyl-2-amino-2-deoxyglucuronate dehydrogenase